MWYMFYGLKYLCNGLCRAVKGDGVANLFAFEGHVDRRLGADGEERLLRHWLCTAVGYQEFAGPDAEKEFLLVGDDDGTVLSAVERGKGYQLLQHPDAGVGVRQLFGIHIASPHHFGAVGVVAVHVGAIVIALLLGRLHLLFGGGGHLLLLGQAGLYDLCAMLLASHE